MASYQVLDLQTAFHYFGDEESTRTMTNIFATEHFNQVLQDHHKNMMAMDFKSLGVTSERMHATSGYVFYPEITNLIIEMREEVKKENKEKLIHIHLILLRKCFNLHRELEDYLQKPLPSPDIKKYVEECLKKLKSETTEFEEGEEKNSNSCAGCSIF